MARTNQTEPDAAPDATPAFQAPEAPETPETVAADTPARPRFVGHVIPNACASGDMIVCAPAPAQ